MMTHSSRGAKITKRDSRQSGLIKDEKIVIVPASGIPVYAVVYHRPVEQTCESLFPMAQLETIRRLRIFQRGAVTEESNQG